MSIKNAAFLILGGGSIGSRHARNLVQLGVQKIRVYDPHGNPQVPPHNDIERTTDWDSLWNDLPDVVLICSPTRSHIDQALFAVRKGCHVFIEKPVSHTLDGIEELIYEIEQRDLRAMVACNLRFHEGPRQIKECVEQGTIGKPLYARFRTGSFLPHWRPGSDYRVSYSADPSGGGITLDAIHELDLDKWIFGVPSLESAMGLKAESLGLSVDGLMEVVLRHGGMMTSIHMNFIQRDRQRSIEVVGTEGTASWDLRSRMVSIYDGEGEVRHQERLSEQESSLMYLREIKHFWSSIEGRAMTPNPVHEARDTLRTAVQIKKCATFIPMDGKIARSEVGI